MRYIMLYNPGGGKGFFFWMGGKEGGRGKFFLLKKKD